VLALERRYHRLRPAYPLSPAGGDLRRHPFSNLSLSNQERSDLDVKKQQLRTTSPRTTSPQVASLAGIYGDDRSRMNQALQEFFKLQEPKETPYRGIVAPRQGQEVFMPILIRTPSNPRPWWAAATRASTFRDGRSLHRVLVLYRMDKEHPMGHREIELAFEIERDNQTRGWSFFRWTWAGLKETYGA